MFPYPHGKRGISAAKTLFAVLHTLRPAWCLNPLQGACLVGFMTGTLGVGLARRIEHADRSSPDDDAGDDADDDACDAASSISHNEATTVSELARPKYRRVIGFTLTGNEMLVSFFSRSLLFYFWCGLEIVGTCR